MQQKVTRQRSKSPIQNNYQFILRLLKLEIANEKKQRHFRLQLYKGFQKIFSVETISTDKIHQFRNTEIEFIINYKEQLRSSYEFNLILYEILQAETQRYEIILDEIVLSLKEFINMYIQSKITYFSKNILISTGKLFYSVKLNQKRFIEDRSIKNVRSQKTNFDSIHQNLKITKQESSMTEIVSSPSKIKQEKTIEQPTSEKKILDEMFNHFTPSKHTSGGNDDKFTSYRINIQPVQVHSIENKNKIARKNSIQKKISHKQEKIVMKQEKTELIKSNSRQLAKEDLLNNQVQEIHILDTEKSQTITQSKKQIKSQRQTLQVPTSIRRINSVRVESGIQQPGFIMKILKFFRTKIGKIILAIIISIILMMLVSFISTKKPNHNKFNKSKKLDKLDEHNKLNNNFHNKNSATHEKNNHQNNKQKTNPQKSKNKMNKNKQKIKKNKVVEQ